MSGAPARVLVTAGSRHGGTQGIAEALARTLLRVLADGGAATTVTEQPVQHAPAPDRFDAVVLGSAVYGGSWRPEARDWATEHAGALRARAVWLFSSGPIGEPPFPGDEPHDVAALLALTGARGHRTFPGRLESARLSFAERAVATAMRAPLGDFRDWTAVEAWAVGLAAELHRPASTGADPG